MNVLYSLQKRPTISKPGYVYYVQFKDEKGHYLSARSTRLSRKDDAIRWCEHQLQNGQVTVKDNVRFDVFSADFFTEESGYVRFHRSRGKQLGPSHLRNQQSYIDNYLLPFFNNVRLKNLDEDLIEEFRGFLAEKDLSSSTINHILIALSLILDWAVRKKYIARKPLIDMVSSHTLQRGILEPEELSKLILSTDWPDCHRTLNLLAYSTGMRQGELLGLQRKSVNVKNRTITVCTSWERSHGLKTTKTGKTRIVPIVEPVLPLLEYLLDQSPYQNPDDLVFHGADPQKPIDHKTVENILYRQFEKIGISQKERISRNLTFHSARHFFNTFMIEKQVPLPMLKAVTGHTTQRMTENYYHPSDMTIIRHAITPLFGKEEDHEETSISNSLVKHLA